MTSLAAVAEDVYRHLGQLHEMEVKELKIKVRPTPPCFWLPYFWSKKLGI
jgi:hypothetical protein